MYKARLYSLITYPSESCWYIRMSWNSKKKKKHKYFQKSIRDWLKTDNKNYINKKPKVYQKHANKTYTTVYTGITGTAPSLKHKLTMSLKGCMIVTKLFLKDLCHVKYFSGVQAFKRLKDENTNKSQFSQKGIKKLGTLQLIQWAI